MADAGSPTRDNRHTEAWQDKPWKHFQRVVFRLQKRIYVRHESRIPAYKNATTEEHSSRDSLFPVPA